MNPPPLLLLIALIALTAAAAALAALARRSRAAVLQKLAAAWNMRYLPDDRFDLAPRVGEKLPTPAAADVLVRDLIFSQDGKCYRYLFTVEYTTGVVRAKTRRVNVGMLVESAQRTGGPGFSEITLAPDDLDAPRQYQWLHERHCVECA